MIPKFRAWISETDTMVNNPKGVDFESETVVLKKIYWDDGFPTEEEVFEVEIGNAILMQSTGICDKRGVKIFEKDIVKFSIDNGFEYICDEIGFVYYCLGAYRILNGLDETLINTNAYLISDIDKIEVLGNIYENPELMEGNA